MRRDIRVLILTLLASLIILAYVNRLSADDFNPYGPAPEFSTLTAQEQQDKAAELEATKDIDRHAEVSRGGSRTMVMEATAYCLTTPTATGGQTGIGVVAADPEIIPLYSRLWIEGYGYATVLDTGEDIRGNRIDVWLPSRADCLRFGRQQVKVEILEAR